MNDDKKKYEVIRKCEICRAYHRGDCPPELLVIKDRYESNIDVNPLR